MSSGLFRIRHSLGGGAGESRTGAALRAGITSPQAYADCQELARDGAAAANRAYQQLRTFAAGTVIALTDSLLLAQPRVCAAVLLDGGFRDGGSLAQPGTRRAARDLHAIHRDSIVLYPDAG